MLDANDIQIISKIVSDALAEERKHTKDMLAQQSRELREEMDARFAQQKKELRKELHEDMMTIIEAEVEPKMRILAEGHEALLERITPASEIETMKADIVILKEAVQHLSKKVNALQKAQ